MKAKLPICVSEMERFYGFDEAAPTQNYIGVETKRQADDRDGQGQDDEDQQ